MKTLQEILLENLKTHNSDLFLKKLKEYFSKSILTVTDFDGNPIEKNTITTLIVFLTNKAEYMNQQKLKHLCDMYGYEISKMGVRWCEVVDDERPYIMLEPREGEDQKPMLDSFLKKCNGNMFHFTDVDNIESIRENGLRIKEAAYRKFQKRIYLVTFKDGQLNPSDGLDLASRVLSDVDRWCAIRLDLSNLKIPIYKDTLMLDNWAYYTYNNIPPKCIEDITIFEYSTKLSTIKGKN